MAYGNSSYGQEFDALQSTTPLHAATFIVAYHSNRVRLFGFSQQQVARAVYDAVSDDWSKVLMNRRMSDVRYSRTFCCDDINLLQGFGIA
jgi:hypothetical protein